MKNTVTDALFRMSFLYYRKSDSTKFMYLQAEKFRVHTPIYQIQLSLEVNKLSSPIASSSAVNRPRHEESLPHSEALKNS